MTPPNLSIIRDVIAYEYDGKRAYCSSRIAAFQSGWNACEPYARAQAIQEAIQWVFDNRYEDTFPTDDMVEHFANDLKILEHKGE